MLRWPTGKEIASATTLVGLAIAWVAALFPGFLPDYIPDECKAAYYAGHEPCTLLYIAVSPIPRILQYIGSFENLHVFFIGLTAVFTGTLFWSTYRLWVASKEQINIATDSADAAKRSADALIKSEMAHVWVKHVEFVGNLPSSEPVIPKFVTTIVNTGKTRAYVKKITLFYIVENRDELLEARRGGERELGFFLPPNDDHDPRNSFGDEFTISAEELERLRTGRQVWLYVRGLVEFETTFEETWESGFAYRVVPQTKSGKVQKNVPIPGRHFWRYAKKDGEE